MSAETWCQLCGDRPALPRGPRDTADVCKTCLDAGDAAAKLDRLYFEQHPGEFQYYRDPLPGEEFTAESPSIWADIKLPGITFARTVEVMRIGKGMRQRRLIWVIR